MGETIALQYRHWVRDGFAVSIGTFRVLEVDSFWPSVVPEVRAGVATRVPLN